MNEKTQVVEIKVADKPFKKNTNLRGQVLRATVRKNYDRGGMIQAGDTGYAFTTAYEYASGTFYLLTIPEYVNDDIRYRTGNFFADELNLFWETV